MCPPAAHSSCCVAWQVSQALLGGHVARCGTGGHSTARSPPQGCNASPNPCLACSVNGPRQGVAEGVVSQLWPAVTPATVFPGSSGLEGFDA